MAKRSILDVWQGFEYASQFHSDITMNVPENFQEENTGGGPLFLYYRCSWGTVLVYVSKRKKDTAKDNSWEFIQILEFHP